MNLLNSLRGNLLLTALLGIVFMPFLTPGIALAATFDPTRIIDNGVFYNSSSMSVQQIQDFLNTKVPTCDTNHAGYVGDSGTAYNPPWVCLKDYYEDNTSTYTVSYTYQNTSGVVVNATRTFTRNNAYVYTALTNPTYKNGDYHQGLISMAATIQNIGGTRPANSISAAQIIWNAAQTYGINPQVLLVTLQKENGLITDTWPAPWQYQQAMGYGCFDYTPCNSQYSGFYNQVISAAWQFKAYANNPNGYNFVPGLGNNVYYSPVTSTCPSPTYSTLNIQNQATASLYDYTPYQPNASALAAGYGTGDGCGAYGNRNFWLYFNAWFGSTLQFNGSITLAQPLTITGTGSTSNVGDVVTASYDVSNSSSYAINAGSLGICARMNGQYYDFGFTNDVNVPAGGTIRISYTKTLDQAGALNVFICSYNAAGGGWLSNTYPNATQTVQTRNVSLAVNENPLVTTGITMTPASPAIGQDVAVSFAITNSGTSPMNVGTMLVAGRDSAGSNFDFPLINDVSIAANGGTYVYTQHKTFTVPGSYSFYIANWKGVWSTNYPKSASGSIVRSMTVNVQDNPLITSGVTLSPANPAIGQQVFADFTITNTSPSAVNVGSMLVAGRNSLGNNVDFPLINDVVVPANGTYVYHQAQTFTVPGSYSLFIAGWKGVWSTNYPKSASSSIVRAMTVNVQDNPLITTGITLSPVNPTVGQQVYVDFTITNTSSSVINVGAMLVAGRSTSGSNVDFPLVNNVTVAANGGTYTYHQPQTFTTTGSYSFYIANWNSVTSWNTNYPRSASTSIVRAMNVMIN